MSDTIKLGEQPPENAARDAIHIAVIPMVAKTWLHPGQKMQYGVVDPYLKLDVRPGERYWLCLYPQTVTGMRHHWTHPGFDDVASATTSVSKEESEKWLRTFCESVDCPGYETVMKAIRGENLDTEDYGRGYDIGDEFFMWWGRDAHADIPPEFWDHVENVTGIPQRIRPSSFGCSC